MSSPTLESLPDDLLLICLAYISRLDYPTLSFVSKRFRSLLASPELYKTRSRLRHTESCLYMCVNYGSNVYRWLTLNKNLNKPLTYDASQKKKNKSSGYVLARVSTFHSSCLNASGLVAVGSNIYYIGVDRSSRVSILDCQTHTWHEGPNLQVEQHRLSASVIDEKIYVAGCYVTYHPHSLENSFQVLDTRTQIWDHSPIHCSDKFCTSKTTCLDGKLYVMVDYTKTLVYLPKEGRWDMVDTKANGMGWVENRWERIERNMWGYMDLSSYCVIDNVLYSTSYERGYVKEAFKWYDTEGSLWRNLKGLVRLPKIAPYSRVILANYGGKMAVLWGELLPWNGTCAGYTKKVWCAVITVRRLKPCEIWGEVEWFDHVLTVPGDCNLEKVLAATV